MATKKKVSFEEQLATVEQLVTQLEEGGLPLDDMMTRYEEGIKLLADLEKQLTEAKQRLTVIRKGADGELVEEPLEGNA